MQGWREQEGVAGQEGQMVSQATAVVSIRGQLNPQSQGLHSTPVPHTHR